MDKCVICDRCIYMSQLQLNFITVIDYFCWVPSLVCRVGSKSPPLKGQSVQWNPSITNTPGTQNFVCYNEVSLSQGLPVYFR